MKKLSSWHPVAQVGVQLILRFLLQDLFCKACWVQFNFLLLSPERQNRNPQLKTHSFVAPPWLAALLISRWFFLSIPLDFVRVQVGGSLTKLSRGAHQRFACWGNTETTSLCGNGYILQQQRVIPEKQEITIEKAMRNKRKCINTVKGLQLFAEFKVKGERKHRFRSTLEQSAIKFRDCWDFSG
ncbi:unnamed protein product [Malus baccata var. baccata]